MNLSVKNKTLLLIYIIVVLFAILLLSIISIEENKKQNKLLEIEAKEISQLFTRIKSKNRASYLEKSLKIINKNGVKEALLSVNRDTLYKLSLESYKLYKKNIPELLEIQYHTVDGTSFLKMSKPEVYGEDQLLNRDMLRQSHRTKELVYGFEIQNKKLVYTLFKPIFLEGEYLGIFEFSVNASAILNEINYYTNVGSVIQVNSSTLYTTFNSQNSKKIVSAINKDSKILKTTIETLGVYRVSSIEIKNKNKNLSTVIFLKNITQYEDSFNEHINYLIIIIFFITFMLLLSVYFLFQFSVKKLEIAHSDLVQYKNKIDGNLITFSTDLKGKIIDVSDAFCVVSGYTIQEVLEGRSDITKYFNLIETIKTEQVYRGEVKLFHKDGDFYWLDVIVQPKYKNKVLIGCDAIMHNITEKKNNDELMVTDGLTSIYNRRHFNDIFPRMINSIRRDGGYLSFLILDIDHFKLYNDNYGHPAGDTTLVSFAKALKDSLKRGDDYCFRLGGEEFGVLYKSANKDDAYLFAQIIRKNIIALEIEHEHNGDEGVVTASMGLVTLNSDELLSADEIYNRADEYMYQAKSTGRNKIVFKS